MQRTIVTIADRPDLAPIVADWIWQEWGRNDGYTLEQTRDYIAASVSRSGPEQVFVLLVDGEPVGSSSLVVADLKERPHLAPWMAGVIVVPEARRRGHVIALIQAVESACRTAGIGTLWLHTEHAERIYARAGWQRVQTVERDGKPPVTLMRRDLAVGPR